MQPNNSFMGDIKKLFNESVIKIILNEKQGVPDFIFNVTNIIIQDVVKKIDDNGINGYNRINIDYELKQYSDKLENCFLNCVILFVPKEYKHFIQDKSGGYTVKNNANILLRIDDGVYDIHNFYNIVGHEIMHCYQNTFNNKELDEENKKKYLLFKDIYERTNEGDMWRDLSYIIYYSYNEEQEAYTVGGRMYLDSIDDDINSNDYNDIIKNTPYKIAYERLMRCKDILSHYLTNEFYKKTIDEFCYFFNIDIFTLEKTLNEDLDKLKRKFGKNISDYLQIKKVSQKDFNSHQFLQN